MWQHRSVSSSNTSKSHSMLCSGAATSWRTWTQLWRKRTGIAKKPSNKWSKGSLSVCRNTASFWVNLYAWRASLNCQSSTRLHRSRSLAAKMLRWANLTAKSWHSKRKSLSWWRKRLCSISKRRVTEALQTKIRHLAAPSIPCPHSITDQNLKLSKASSHSNPTTTAPNLKSSKLSFRRRIGSDNCMTWNSNSSALE